MVQTRPFFSELGINIELFDARLDRGDPTIEGDVEFYVSHAQEMGGPVLELGCGTGRITWELAKAGFEVVGIDISHPMICAADAKRSKLPKKVQKRVSFLDGNMADFDLPGRVFPLVIIPFRAFHHLTTPEQQQSCLACVHHLLRPGGWLIIHLFDPRLDYCLPESATYGPGREATRNPISGNMVEIEIVKRQSDPLKQVITEVWQFSEVDGSGGIIRQELEQLSVRWTYRYEMRYLLALCGYDVDAEYSNFLGDPPEYGKEQIVVASRR